MWCAKSFGENLDTLAIYAKQLGNISNTVKGARDLYVETVTGMPQMVINIIALPLRNMV